MNEDALRLALGQRLCTGLPGPRVTEEFARVIREKKIGNVILFRRNIESKRQLKALCAALTALITEETGLPPFLMIDEECGSVSRLAPLFGPTPSAMAVGAAEDPEYARAVGREIGGSLREMGLNLNLGPVLDCSSNPDNLVIGNRSFGRDPHRAAACGAAYARGLREAGVLACGKHFPGHGDTAVDSHLDLPVIGKSLAAMEKTELVPFAAAIREGIDALMTAHICFPALEESSVPATLSEKVIGGLLRRKMGFDGLVISDGMEMQAVMRLCGMEEAVLRALGAGVDIALICHEPLLAAAGADRLLRAAETGALNAENILRSDARIRGVKAGLPSARAGSAGREARMRLSEEIMRAAVRVVHAPEGRPLPPVGRDTLFLGAEARAASVAADPEPMNAAEACARFFSGRYAGAAAEDAGAASAVVFLDAHPQIGRFIRAARSLAQRGVPVIAVSLHTDALLDRLPDTVWKICAWQHDALALAAVERLLSGRG